MYNLELTKNRGKRVINANTLGFESGEPGSFPHRTKYLYSFLYIFPNNTYKMSQLALIIAGMIYKTKKV